MIDETAVTSLSALAHSDRLTAYRKLIGAGPNGMPSGDIAGALSIPPTRMSFHLATLERAGLLRSWRDGRQVRYAVEFAAMRNLLAYLAEDCCGGHPEVCGVDLQVCKFEEPDGAEPAASSSASLRN